MALPIIQTGDQSIMLLQQRWSSQLNPVLANLLIQGEILEGIALINGVTTFNHYLNKQMTGWQIIDQTAPANISRSQPLNSQTLTLTSDAAVTISLWVF